MVMYPFGCEQCGCGTVKSSLPEGLAYGGEAQREFFSQISCAGCGLVIKPHCTDEVWIDNKKTYATRNMRFN